MAEYLDIPAGPVGDGGADPLRRLRQSARNRGKRILLTSLAAPLLVAVVAYAILGFNEGHAVGSRYAGNPSVFIKAGPLFAAPKLLPKTTPLFPQTGYDGQFFFYIAQDPLLRGKVAKPSQTSSPHIDNVAYRYQRILLPVLGWLTSWGNPDVLSWTMPLINLLSVLGSGFLLARFLRRRGRSPALALVYMLSVGVMIGVVDDLSDPLAASLLVAGTIWWLEERQWPSILALTLCLLAREIALIPVAAICLAELARRRGRGLPWLVPLVVLGAWQVYLRATFAASPTAGSNKPSVVPLLGVARKVKLILKEDAWGVGQWELLFILLLLLIWLAFFTCSVQAASEFLRDRNVSRERLLPVIALASVVLVPFLTVDLWHYIPSYSRYAAPAAGLMVLLYAVRGERWLLRLSIALLALSLVSPVASLVPTDTGPTGTPSVGIGF